MNPTTADLDAMLSRGARVREERNARRKDTYANRVAVPVANMEPHPKHEPVGQKQVVPLDTQGRVNLRFTGYRHRLTDPDGQSAKACVDGLVHAGIFRDDSSKEIAEVRFAQEKIGTDEEEWTEILITEAGC